MNLATLETPVIVHDQNMPRVFDGEMHARDFKCCKISSKPGMLITVAR